MCNKWLLLKRLHTLSDIFSITVILYQKAVNSKARYKSHLFYQNIVKQFSSILK